MVVSNRAARGPRVQSSSPTASCAWKDSKWIPISTHPHIENMLYDRVVSRGREERCALASLSAAFVNVRKE